LKQATILLSTVTVNVTIAVDTYLHVLLSIAYL